MASRPRRLRLLEGFPSIGRDRGRIREHAQRRRGVLQTYLLISRRDASRETSDGTLHA